MLLKYRMRNHLSCLLNVSHMKYVNILNLISIVNAHFSEKDKLLTDEFLTNKKYFSFKF